ncbi:MAG: porin [Gammaproteobacteria bacterium]|nr:porin [Gammaproteobacteria bacterium]
MNKKLLTMAVGTALAMGAMNANAETTAYGQLQMELASVTKDIDSDNVGVTTADGNNSDNQSGLDADDNKRGRLGIKASEDLGNGMTGLAKFEWQVDTSNANLTDGTREALVGLKGGFGTIEIGQLKGAYKYTGGVMYDAFVTTFLEARGSNGAMLGNDIQTGELGNNKAKAWLQHAFVQDALNYKNKWGIVSLWVTLGLQGLNTETSDDRNTLGDMALAVSVGDKNWEAFVAMVGKEVRNNNGAGTLQNRGGFGATKIGGKFKFGGGSMSHTIKLQLESFALIGDEQVDIDTGNATFGSATAAVIDDEMTGSATFLGYDLGLGNTTITLQAGNSVQSLDNQDGTTAGDYDRTRTYTALGVTHKFSKQTRVFAGFRTTVQETDNLPVGAADPTLTTSVVSVGLRKDF